ncbi:MAG: ATP-dependent helicase HrpB [Acidobacteriaceae bacterium]|nr:ATP-dependent helicase HrpB [Acidobacteriaceae bacterium]
MNPLPLPIDPLLPKIVHAVQTNPITLLEAEPGAGKTTRVPAALLSAGFHDIYVLEPRRLAARMAARRVAEETGERVGARIGYQVRFEEVSSAQTKLWFLTEGVLTRKLLGEGGLKQARVVILDEFHERHLETDLALALLRKAQEKRPDLRIVLMSATLGTSRLAAQLGHPEVITSPGQSFPVEVRYTPVSASPLEEQVESAVKVALEETAGHILVFLPGAAEIRKALQACEGIARRLGANLLPLHGDLSAEQQDAAVAPSTQRKVICSTNVAESSITIEGVTAVVDSGLARVLAHSPWSGLSRLRVEKISKSSAIQRAGRAGRTGPGLAIRLYTRADFERRAPQVAPEITRSDLSHALLLIAANGFAWNDLPWLDEPSVEMHQNARELLGRLGALNERGSITASGSRMARLPVHPRLARFVFEVARMGQKREGCRLAAQLSEGRYRLDEGTRLTSASDIDALLGADLSYTTNRLAGQLSDAVEAPRRTAADSSALEKALLSAFPDRVARKRGDTLLLASGGSAKLDRASHVHGNFLAAIEIDDRSAQSAPLVRLAAPIEPDWLLDLFPERVSAREEMVWNRESERVEQLNSIVYDQLTIDESRSAPTDALAASKLLAEKVLESGIERFVGRQELNGFLSRVHFAAREAGVSVPDNLLASTVAEMAVGLASFAELRSAASNGGFLRLLRARLPMRLIDEVAPLFIQLPSGRHARIEYHEDRPPSVASRLQDFFGMRETPSVARGSVPLVVHLLAPNQRPVQVTTDLVSFWKNLYPQVRRELSRRYPKHAWPEVPA